MYSPRFLAAVVDIFRCTGCAYGQIPSNKFATQSSCELLKNSRLPLLRARMFVKGLLVCSCKEEKEEEEKEDEDQASALT